MGKKNPRHTIVPRTKCVLNKYLCILCLRGIRFISPLPSLNPKHLLGRENSVAIVNFFSARIDWDRFTRQPRSTGTFQLSSSWHSGHFTLLNICLALSHQVRERGWQSHAKQGFISFRLQRVCLFCGVEPKSISTFGPLMPHTLRIAGLAQYMIDSFPPLMRKFKIYKKCSM